MDLIKGLEEAGLPPTPRATANQKPAWDHLQKIEWRTARAWMCPFVHNVCTCTDTDLFCLTCVYQCVCVCVRVHVCVFASCVPMPLNVSVHACVLADPRH